MNQKDSIDSIGVSSSRSRMLEKEADLNHTFKGSNPDS